MSIAQSIALVLLIGLAVVGALELDRRVATCDGLLLMAGQRP